MSRQTDFKNALNVGELSPDGWSRSDLAQFSRGCRLGYNMIGRVMGPVGRRRGTWFCGLTKHQDKAGRLFGFRRSSGDALVIELGDLYGRVWTVNGTPVLSGGTPVEFVTPWTAAQVEGLRFKQIGDLVYVTHRDGLRPQTIKRTSNTSWSVTPTVFLDGPWRAENTNQAHSLSLTGGNALNSDVAFFQPGHAGALFRLRAGDGVPGVLSWEPEEGGLTLGVQRLSNGAVYEYAGGSTTSGNTPPIHTSGVVSDGAADWRFLHDGAGVVRVTTVHDNMHCTVEVVTPPPSQVEIGTRFWAEGAYSDYRGWPTAAPAVREERLALAAAAAEPDMVCFTRTAGFSPAGLDFKPGLGTGRVVDDDAVTRFVGDERNQIVWLVNTTYLLAATTEGEFVITGATLDDPISPSGNVARPLSEYGAADVTPVLAHGGCLFVGAGGESLFRTGLAADQSLIEGELTVGADHIGARGLAELSWMRQPDNLLWVRLADGGQASMTYHAEQQVRGWNRHGLAALSPPTEDAPLGGGLIVESQCVVPGDGGRSRLFLLARRQKAGATQRMILRMADPGDRLFLDAAEAYVGTAVNAVDGLDHLDGEAVTVMAATETGASATPGRGWGEYEGRTVEDGEVALPEDVTATRLQAGLPYLSRWEGLPPETQGPGSTAGRKVRWTHAVLTVDAAIAYVGTTGEDGDSGTDRLLNRTPADVAGPAVRRKTWKTPLLGGAEFERRLFVETRSGFDLVLHSIRATADVE